MRNKKEEGFIKLSWQEFEVVINPNDIINIDGYIPILSTRNIDDNVIEVITAVIDEDYNLVVPFRKSIVSKEDFEKYNFDNEISVYKNKKAIYRVNENEFYVIDLEKVEFVYLEGVIMPKNPIKQMALYYGINDEKIIMYTKDQACMYDITQDKIISNIYNAIKPYEENEKLFLAYYLTDKNKYVNPLIIEMLITTDGGIVNEAILNKEISVVLPDNILGNKKKTIKYCNDCFNFYVEDKDDYDYSKVLQ